MKQRYLLTVLAGTALTLAGALPANATSGPVGPGSVRYGEWVHYTTQRTITVAGSNIYIRKTEGPELRVKWRRCAGGAQGEPTTLPNADPTPVVRIGTGFLSGTVFCLSAFSLGNNATDDWTGTVWWNVDQAPSASTSAASRTPQTSRTSPVP